MNHSPRAIRSPVAPLALDNSDDLSLAPPRLVAPLALRPRFGSARRPGRLGWAWGERLAPLPPWAPHRGRGREKALGRPAARLLASLLSPCRHAGRSRVCALRAEQYPRASPGRRVMGEGGLVSRGYHALCAMGVLF